MYAFLLTTKYAFPEAVRNVFRKTEHECPNCRSKFTVEPLRAQQIIKGGAVYSSLRGEDYLDENITAYANERTSEEQVGVKGATDVEEGNSQGAIKI
jgi:hypothetical protein